MPGPAKSGFQDKVFVSPLARIIIGGVTIGKLQNLTFTENLQRLELRSLGDVYTQELPLTGISCSFTAQAAVFELDGLGDVPNPFWPLAASTPQEFANTILLGDVQVNIEIFAKYDSKGNPRRRLVLTPDVAFHPMGMIRDAVIESRSINMANDQIFAQNITGRYLKPMGI